jgi:K+-sensing histidine kinase KdpD
MARRGLRRLLRLSEQLAIAADLADGPIPLERAPADVRDVVRAALDRALGIDGRRDVVASLHAPDDPVGVDIDRRMIGTVLREIIGNALRLATSRVRVEIDRTEAVVSVRVEDDGPGFSAEALGRLDGHTVIPGTRGLGLSLCIARSVLWTHEASMVVEQSTLPPGRRGRAGAAVIVRFPRCAV